MKLLGELRGRKTLASEVDEARLDLAEAEAREALADYQGQLAAATRAATRGQAQGMPLLVAQAYYLQGNALSRLGERAKGAIQSDQARQLFAAAGDRVAEIRVLNRIANSNYEAGEFDAAQRAYEQELAVSRELGNNHGVALALQNIGSCWLIHGQLTKARTMLQQALALERDNALLQMEAVTLVNLADVALVETDLPQARALSAESLRISREIGNTYSLHSSLWAHAEVALAAGELEVAQGACAEGLASSHQTNQPFFIALNNYVASKASFLGGDAGAARRELQEAIRIQRAQGFRLELGDSQLQLGLVELEEGQPAEAAKLLREAQAAFKALNAVDREARATGELARAWLAMNQLGQAKEASAQALVLAAKSQNVLARLSVELAAALVLAASGDAPGAEQRLKALHAQAQRGKLVLLGCEVRLALAEVSRLQGKAANAREQLSAVHDYALEHGILLYANKAAGGAIRESQAPPKDASPKP